MKLNIDLTNLEPPEVLEYCARCLEGRSELALQFWLAAMKLNDREGLYPYRAAKLLMKAARYDEAVELLKTSLELTPDHMVTRYLVAKCLTHLGHFEPALDEIDLVIAAVPENNSAISLRFHILVLCGQYSEAMSYYGEHSSQLLSNANVLAFLVAREASRAPLPRNDEITPAIRKQLWSILKAPEGSDARSERPAKCLLK